MSAPPCPPSTSPELTKLPTLPPVLSPDNQGMEWTALPTPSSSPTPSHRSPHPTANAFPSELFTRQYLQPMIRYYNSSEPNLPAPPAAVTHLPPPISPRPQHRPTPSSSSGNHKVHEIYCQCDTLLSDRGMKAVLLLNPHITLYSTDSVPSSTGPLAEMGDQGQVKTRTCDCLTEGIGCLCCGSLVGYHILNPVGSLLSLPSSFAESTLTTGTTPLVCSARNARARSASRGQPTATASSSTTKLSTQRSASTRPVNEVCTLQPRPLRALLVAPPGLRRPTRRRGQPPGLVRRRWS